MPSTDLTDKFTTLETQLATEHTETLDKVESVKGADAISLTDLNNLIGLLLTSVDGLASTVADLAATVETIGNNISTNAQNSQNIALGSIGVCCTTITPGAGTVDSQCQKAQQMADLVATKLCLLTGYSTSSSLPTISTIVATFTTLLDNGLTRPVLTSSEAAAVLAQLSLIGSDGFSHLCDLNTDTLLKAAIKTILFSATSPYDALADIALLDPTGFSEDAAVVRVYLSAFSASLVNLLWDTSNPFSGAGYTDDCSPPPFEGAGWDGQGVTADSAGYASYSGVHGNIDLDTVNEGNISPVPHEAIGQTLYFYNCYSLPSIRGRSQSLWLGTDNVDQASIFLEVPYHTEVSWTVTSDRFIYIWIRGANGLAPGTGELRWAWVAGEAQTHCPS
jgi:hypothetical protein